MDNDPQNTPQSQFNAPEPVTPTEAVPVAPPEPVTPPTFPTEPAPTQAPNKSKKKLIIILIIIAILLAGGGVAGAILLTPKKTSTKTAISTNKTNTTTAPATKAIPYPGYPEVINLYGANISINAPDSLDLYTKDDYSIRMTLAGSTNKSDKGPKDKSHYITFILHNDNKPTEIDNSKIIDNYMRFLTQTVDSSYGIYGGNDLLRVETERSEQKTINDINVLRSVGKAIFKDAWDKEFSANFISYTYSINGFPCLFIGFNIDNYDQDQEDVDKLISIVDGMINTMRVRERP